MNKQEQELLRNEIQMKNVMTKKILGWAKKSFFLAIIMAVIAYWGFSGMEDSFLSVSDGIRNVVKWISLIIAILSGLFAILSFISFRNSKKHILMLIDTLEAGKKKTNRKKI